MEQAKSGGRDRFECDCASTQRNREQSPRAMSRGNKRRPQRCPGQNDKNSTQIIACTSLNFLLRLETSPPHQSASRHFLARQCTRITASWRHDTHVIAKMLQPRQTHENTPRAIFSSMAQAHITFNAASTLFLEQDTLQVLSVRRLIARGNRNMHRRQTRTPVSMHTMKYMRMLNAPQNR